MTKILVIEDSADIRDVIIDTLEFADYEVKAAINGKQGVAFAHDFMPELILCDVMMPELDGYGVLLELSQDAFLGRVPFIFLTAKATKEDMRRGMALGADDYLTKPFSVREFVARVKAILRRTRIIQNKDGSTT
ncbi:MAG: response regulator, partial [Chloroflexota bacterium]